VRVTVAPAIWVSSGSVRSRAGERGSGAAFSVKLAEGATESTGASVRGVIVMVEVTGALVPGPAPSESASVTCQVIVRLALPCVGSSPVFSKVTLRSTVV